MPRVISRLRISFELWTHLKYERLEFLIAEKRGLVVALRVRGDGTEDGLEMLHRHSQYSQLVQLSRHRVTHWHHRRQLGDVRVHLVPSALLDFAVVLPEYATGKRRL